MQKFPICTIYADSNYMVLLSVCWRISTYLFDYGLRLLAVVVDDDGDGSVGRWWRHTHSKKVIVIFLQRDIFSEINTQQIKSRFLFLKFARCCYTLTQFNWIFLLQQIFQSLALLIFASIKGTLDQVAAAGASPPPSANNCFALRGPWWKDNSSLLDVFILIALLRTQHNERAPKSNDETMGRCTELRVCAKNLFPFSRSSSRRSCEPRPGPDNNNEYYMLRWRRRTIAFIRCLLVVGVAPPKSNFNYDLIVDYHDTTPV